MMSDTAAVLARYRTPSQSWRPVMRRLRELRPVSEILLPMALLLWLTNAGAQSVAGIQTARIAGFIH